MYLKGEAVEGEVAVITRQQAEEADYNLSPGRWIAQGGNAEHRAIKAIVADMLALDEKGREIDQTLAKLLAPL
jgi:type I restriction enzyme M protein